MAVNFGYRVTAGEAAQQFAYEHVDSSVVRVRHVYCFVQEKSNTSMKEGYLFIEYIPGQNLEILDLIKHLDIVSRVSEIIAHLGQVSDGQVPGPLR